MIAAILKRRVPGCSTWIFWAYLLLITAAELITTFVQPRSGLVLHAGILVVLIVHAAIAPSDREGNLTLCLTVAPLIRILSLSLPLFDFPRMLWYPLVAIPLLVWTTMATRHLRVSRHELGLHGRDLLPQLLLMGMGFGLGITAYNFLRPPPLLSSFTRTTVWLPALSLMVCTGVLEEVIFRGLLQSTAPAVLGRGAFVYVSLLFAALQIGFRSIPQVGLALSMGLVFAYIVHRSRSIVGVALAHGTANVTLLLIMPELAWHYPGHARSIGANIGTIGLLLASIGAGMLLWRASRRRLITGSNSVNSAIGGLNSAEPRL